MQRLQRFVHQIKSNGGLQKGDREEKVKDQQQKTHEELRLKFEEILNQKEKKATHYETKHHQNRANLKKQGYEEKMEPTSVKGDIFDS